MEAAQTLPVIDASARHISPTDVSQFLRLEQCQRYLRLRLHERAYGPRFLYDYGVQPQAIPPLLTRSGATFERRVEQAVQQCFPSHHFAAERTANPRDHDNAQVLHHARDLGPGEVLVLFQPRLHLELGDWRVRGDIDLLRLERTVDGQLHVLVADMKASTSAKVEHRLQVAFYLEMLAALFQRAAIPLATQMMGILYRGPADDGAGISEAKRTVRAQQIEAAQRSFGVTDALLEVVTDAENYRAAVRDLVTGPGSTAARVAEAPFADLFFHLTYKCDGCLYTEFCMKWAAEHDDLPCCPTSPPRRRPPSCAGVTTVRQLATVKEPVPPATAAPDTTAPPDLVTAPGQAGLVRQLAAAWPVGPRLDELVHRARRARQLRNDRITAIGYIPSKGYGSLPHSAPDHNPNLVRVYLDAQHDYLHDRICLLGALVVGTEHGTEPPHRRRSIVHLTDGPPDTPARERNLFVGFTQDVVRAVAAVAAPDDAGERRAPVHLIFYDRFAQQVLLMGLARHLASILEATPLYDFVTQLAAFDSPVVTFLDQEIRERKNYPMVCQSLQAVASYLKFDWNAPAPYREVFRTRLFDYWSRFDTDPGGRNESHWYTGRARFNSQIPLEYAYAAWDELAAPSPGDTDDFAAYRRATPALLRGFQARRLEALEWVAKDFPGNRQTQLRLFDLPDLATSNGAAQTLARALDEFVTIERHADLATWKAARLAPPERRVLAGEALIVAYRDEDKYPGVADRNREHRKRAAQADVLRAASPDGRLTKDQAKETRWSQDGMRVRLRLVCDDVDCGVEEALALTTLREGDGVVVLPRWTTDSRPGMDPTPFTPTPKQLLYGTRAALVAIAPERDEQGQTTGAVVEIELRAAHAPKDARGFVFGAMPRPFVPGERYTLDPDPNDWYGYFGMKVVEGLCAGEHNVLYERLVAPAAATVSWPPAAQAGQARFLAGLDALQRAGALHPFEPSKQAYIGRYGDAPVLLVQGPPGTGKSYATAFAVFARLQGALAADRDFRVIASCKTHAATNVLLQNVAHVQALLQDMQQRHSAVFAQFFDARLLDVPLFRLHANAPVEGVIGLRRKEARAPGERLAADTVTAARWCVVGATPGGVYRMLREKWNGLFGHPVCDALVLDETSQMNLPEAIMAALPLRDDGPVIVVGDHRQMPPIVKHDWAREARRTFQQFQAYESLFRTLLPMQPQLIQFAESFRLHADMAEFLRREVYSEDGIAFFSRCTETLPPHTIADPFVAGVLRPEATIVAVVHDEDRSMVRNAFEESLIAAILEPLGGTPYRLDPAHGLGVVVPHRAQRAALQQDVPYVSVLDPQTGRVVRSAVDTVERFQGDERTVILVGATESDPQYLLASSEFLLDPRRLTVALSRAKQKLILIAARSVFALLATDEETFAHAQLWKNLLRRTCTVPLWRGERAGRWVEVWGNSAPSDREQHV